MVRSSPSILETSFLINKFVSLRRRAKSHPRHKSRDHLLQPGLLEVYLQFRAIGGEDLAVAEFFMVDALADLEAGPAGAGRDEFGLAVDDGAGL